MVDWNYEDTFWALLLATTAALHTGLFLWSLTWN